MGTTRSIHGKLKKKKERIFQSEHLKGRGGVVDPGAEEGEIILKSI
jgi:hypothetical protein